MKAVEISKYGPPTVIRLADIFAARKLRSGSSECERFPAGPLDALVREGRSGVTPALSLTLGPDIAGTVDRIGHAESNHTNCFFRVANPVLS